MLNELYTFAEPVQVVPFSNLKWGKFTLLHTALKTNAAKVKKDNRINFFIMIQLNINARKGNKYEQKTLYLLFCATL